MKTVPYIIKSGDTLTDVARRFGMSSWEQLYQLPENAEFRERRSDPSKIFPGDMLNVPAVNDAARRLGAFSDKHFPFDPNCSCFDCGPKNGMSP